MSTVLENHYDPNYEPTETEIIEYGQWLGLDLPKDNDLLFIAKEGLKAALPDHWKACKSEKGELYYFNFKTGGSIWDHPMDEWYKGKVKEAKQAKKEGRSVVPEEKKKDDTKKDGAAAKQDEKPQAQQQQPQQQQQPANAPAKQESLDPSGGPSKKDKKEKKEKKKRSSSASSRDNSAAISAALDGINAADVIPPAAVMMNTTETKPSATSKQDAPPVVEKKRSSSATSKLRRVSSKEDTSSAELPPAKTSQHQQPSQDAADGGDVSLSLDSTDTPTHNAATAVSATVTAQPQQQAANNKSTTLKPLAGAGGVGGGNNKKGSKLAQLKELTVKKVPPADLLVLPTNTSGANSAEHPSSAASSANNTPRGGLAGKAPLHPLTATGAPQPQQESHQGVTFGATTVASSPPQQQQQPQQQQHVAAAAHPQAAQAHPASILSATASKYAATPAPAAATPTPAATPVAAPAVETTIHVNTPQPQPAPAPAVGTVTPQHQQVPKHHGDSAPQQQHQQQQQSSSVVSTVSKISPIPKSNSLSPPEQHQQQQLQQLQQDHNQTLQQQKQQLDQQLAAELAEYKTKEAAKLQSEKDRVSAQLDKILDQSKSQLKAAHQTKLVKLQQDESARLQQEEKKLETETAKKLRDLKLKHDEVLKAKSTEVAQAQAAATPQQKQGSGEQGNMEPVVQVLDDLTAAARGDLNRSLTEFTSELEIHQNSFRTAMAAYFAAQREFVQEETAQMLNSEKQSAEETIAQFRDQFAVITAEKEANLKRLKTAAETAKQEADEEESKHQEAVKKLRDAHGDEMEAMKTVHEQGLEHEKERLEKEMRKTLEKTKEELAQRNKEEVEKMKRANAKELEVVSAELAAAKQQLELQQKRPSMLNEEALRQLDTQRESSVGSNSPTIVVTKAVAAAAAGTQHAREMTEGSEVSEDLYREFLESKNTSPSSTKGGNNNAANANSKAAAPLLGIAPSSRSTSPPTTGMGLPPMAPTQQDGATATAATTLTAASTTGTTLSPSVNSTSFVSQMTSSSNTSTGSASITQSDLKHAVLGALQEIFGGNMGIANNNGNHPSGAAAAHSGERRPSGVTVSPVTTVGDEDLGSHSPQFSSGVDHGTNTTFSLTNNGAGDDGAHPADVSVGGIVPPSYHQQIQLIEGERHRLQRAEAFVEDQRASLEERRTSLKAARSNWKKDVLAAKAEGVSGNSKRGKILRNVHKCLDKQADGLAYDDQVLRESETWIQLKAKRLERVERQLEEQLQQQQRARFDGSSPMTDVSMASVDTTALVSDFYPPHHVSSSALGNNKQQQRVNMADGAENMLAKQSRKHNGISSSSATANSSKDRTKKVAHMDPSMQAVAMDDFDPYDVTGMSSAAAAAGGLGAYSAFDNNRHHAAATKTSKRRHSANASSSQPTSRSISPQLTRALERIESRLDHFDTIVSGSSHANAAAAAGASSSRSRRHTSPTTQQRSVGFALQH